MLDDVLVVVQRAEMTTRMADEIERNCVELGEEGRLISMQLDELMELLGYPRSSNPLDQTVAPRGYRVLSHIPRLPDAVVKRVVSNLAGLEGIVRASQRELEAVEGVGTVRAREIREGLRRLQEHNLVDRYLQL